MSRLILLALLLLSPALAQNMPGPLPSVQADILGGSQQYAVLRHRGSLAEHRGATERDRQPGPLDPQVECAGTEPQDYRQQVVQ